MLYVLLLHFSNSSTGFRLNGATMTFKAATMTFKALHTGHPLYLTDQLQYYMLTSPLRSSGSHQLVKPWHSLSFGSCAFCISAPHIWNSLPTNIREAQSLLTLRCHLKTHYFQSAFSTPLATHPPMCPDSF